MATATLNTQGGALLPTNNGGQASPFGTPTALNTFASGVAAAPVGKVKTTDAPATPTTVVSTQTASDHVAGPISKTIAQGNQDVANQQNIKATNDANAKAGLTPASSSNSSTVIPPVTPAPKTPAQQLADTPPDDSTWVYNTSTGERAPLKNGSPMPPGYTPNNPSASNTKPIVGSATTSFGTVFQKYADGTYGSVDVNGKYIGPAQETDFTNAQNANDSAKSLDDLRHGTYPLTANQQAQLDSLKAMFAQQVKQQEVSNRNFTGGVTVAENLYGMGNSIAGLGEIQGAIDSGTQKINDINAKMTSAVAQMESAFQADDMTLLKTSFDMYHSLVSDRQGNLDKIQAALVAKQQSDRAYDLQVKQMEQTHNDTIDNDIRTVMTEAQKGNASASQLATMKTALNNHDYSGAVQAAGGSLQDPTSPAGMYSAYVNKQKSLGKAPMAAGDFLAAQKYKEAYASASASAAAQGAYSSSDKNQNKLEHQFQQSGLSSRSDLGLQNKKVSQAIHLQTLLNGSKDAKGNYNVPATYYHDLVLGLANLLSPNGVAAQNTIDNLTQKTAVGDFNGALTYVTGTPMNGSTQDVLKLLAKQIDLQGQQSEVLRNQQLASQTPTDLSASRANRIVGDMPSYSRMSAGSTEYQTPEEINDTAVTKLADFKTANPQAYASLQSTFPNKSPVWIAQQAGLLPATK